MVARMRWALIENMRWAETGWTVIQIGEIVFVVLVQMVLRHAY